MWIGGHDIGREGDYLWITGEPMHFTSWASGEPNNLFWWEDCVQIFLSGDAILWNDRHCADQCPYICEEL